MCALYVSHFLPLYTENLSLDFSGLPDELDPSMMPLRFEELPKPGTLVAIDAELVPMRQVGSHSTRLVHILERILLFHRKKQSSGLTGRTVSFSRLASVMCFCLAKGRRKRRNSIHRRPYP